MLNVSAQNKDGMCQFSQTRHIGYHTNVP